MVRRRLSEMGLAVLLSITPLYAQDAAPVSMKTTNAIAVYKPLEGPVTSLYDALGVVERQGAPVADLRGALDRFMELYYGRFSEVGLDPAESLSPSELTTGEVYEPGLMEIHYQPVPVDMWSPEPEDSSLAPDDRAP